MAIRSLPIQLKNRTPLQDLIPLDTPMSILVSPTDYCNIKCIFCPFHGPTAETSREKTIMSLDMFKNLVEQMRAFPRRTKTLIFCGRGEPTLHKELSQMISFAKNAVDSIRLTTNGINLSPALNRELIESGLDYIKISVPAIDVQAAFDITGVQMDLKQYIQNIRNLYQNKPSSMTIYCKISNIALGGAGGEHDPVMEERFYSMFDDVCDYCFIENIAPVKSNSTTETLEKMGIQNFSDKNIYGLPDRDTNTPICERLFYHLTIMSNGDVFPCDLNVGDSLLLGNVQHTTLQDIWNGDALKNIRLAFVKGHTPESCADCGGILYDYPNNLHKYANVIYQRLVKE